jgi:hypothetical protein
MKKIRCWSGSTEWHDGVAHDTHWASRADRHPDGCPTEGGRAPVGGGQVPDGGYTGVRRRVHGCPTESTMGARRRARWIPDGGRVSGGGPMAGLGAGPTGEYISAASPHFWALSSNAESHLQEMRVRRVLMSESGHLRGEFRKGMFSSSMLL